MFNDIVEREILVKSCDVRAITKRDVGLMLAIFNELRTREFIVGLEIDLDTAHAYIADEDGIILVETNTPLGYDPLESVKEALIVTAMRADEVL